MSEPQPDDGAPKAVPFKNRNFLVKFVLVFLFFCSLISWTLSIGGMDEASGIQGAVYFVGAMVILTGLLIVKTIEDVSS